MTQEHIKRKFETIQGINEANTTFKYNGENYTGAQFTITLPLS